MLKFESVVLQCRRNGWSQYGTFELSFETKKTSGFSLLQKKSHWNFFGSLQSGRANPQKNTQKDSNLSYQSFKG